MICNVKKRNRSYPNNHLFQTRMKILCDFILLCLCHSRNVLNNFFKSFIAYKFKLFEVDNFFFFFCVLIIEIISGRILNNSDPLTF